MVDMKKSPAEKAEDSCPTPIDRQPDYPYGLCISLCDDELEKLDLDVSDVEPGDMLHLHCLATVTSKSERTDIPAGPSCRVELQITHVSIPESEDEENRDADKSMTPAKKMSKLYSA